MGHDGDEPPVAVRPKPAVETDAPAKRRRRKRRGKRSRWPYAVARDAFGRPEGPTITGENSPITLKAAPAIPVSGQPRSGQVPKSSSALSASKRKANRQSGGAKHYAPVKHDVHIAAMPAPVPDAMPAIFVAPIAIERNGVRAQPYRAAGRNQRGNDLYAALDLGTNNCRLLVAEPNRGGFHVIDAFSRIVRLGEGMSASGRLSDIAQARAIEALHICRAKLESRGVNRVRLVATEACRIAENGANFIDRVEHETGLTLEVVSRETEARLAVAGCANLVDWEADGVLLFDIGGGSSELVWLDLKTKNRRDDLARHIRAWTSLPVGVVTLSERHGGVVVDRRVFEEMVRDVDGMLDGLVEGADLSAALQNGPFHMLGTSGTVTTLAGVHLGLRRYDRRRIDGVWLGSGDVGGMIDRLLDMSFDERVANPCIGADRADLVLAGCAILEAIRRRWPCERLRVADRGLREGILTELMAADGVWRRGSHRPDDGFRGGNAANGPTGRHGNSPGSTHERQ